MARKIRGKGSWFGGPHDSMAGSTTASGASVRVPGIAVYDRSTLGGYWLVRAPNGRKHVLKQTDLGPAPWTGRKIDVTYSALRRLGYNERSFPTDAGTFKATYLGKNPHRARRIAKATGSGGGGASARMRATAAVPGLTLPQVSAGGSTAIVDALRASLQRPAAPPVSAPTPPLTPALPLPKGYQAIQPSDTGAPSTSKLDDALSAIQGLAGPDLPTIPGGGSAAVQNRARAVAGHTSRAASSRLGRVIVSPTADRPGVHVHKGIIHFGQKVAGIIGHTLTLGTGTRHNRMTVNGNVSDHWTGEAGDFPASGGRLTMMGHAALIAAGADPKWARKQKGGLFNIGHWQIIYNTTQGGNHWNHLHVGFSHARG